MSLKTCQNMQEVRAEIDRLDRQLVPLLLERLHYIAEAGHIKGDRDAVRDDWRIEDVVAKARASAVAENGNADFIEAVYRELIEQSIAFEYTVFDGRKAQRQS